MYRIRNVIVHSAAHDLDIPVNILAITTNLSSYVGRIIDTILSELSYSNDLQELSQVYTKYQITYDLFTRTLKDDTHNKIDPVFIINPLSMIFPSA